jgi:hypothetical protein
MVQSDVDSLDIFLGSNGKAIISKKIANKNKISKARKELKEEEILRIITWFIDTKCKQLGVDELSIDLDNKSSYLLKIVHNNEDNNLEND